MKQLLLESTEVGLEENYDADYPTRQTELLALDIRRILHGLNGFTASQFEANDFGVLDADIVNSLADIDDAIDDKTQALFDGAEIPSPSVPETVLSGLIDAVVAGLLPPQYAWLLPVIRWGVRKYLSNRQRIDLSGIESVGAQLQALADLQYNPDTEEPYLAGIQDILLSMRDADTVCIAHTQELDKVVFIAP